MDEVSESQQSGYTQCKIEFKWFVSIFVYYLHKWFYVYGIRLMRNLPDQEFGNTC